MSPDELKRYADGLPERRRGYRELAEEMKGELQDHADRIEGRLHSFFARCLVTFAILGITSAGALLGFGVVLKNQKATTNQIQAQREEFIRRNCEDQNDRHDDTIEQFKIAAALVSKKHPEQAKQIRESVEQNLLIIKALVPKQNCDQIVAQATKLGEGQ